MPFYDFINDNTGEIKTLFFHMNDKKEYTGEDGFVWRRLFEVVQASIDTRIDPNNPKDFVEKTRNKKGTLGGLWDKSKELSIKRGGNSGIDPIKEKTYDDYEKRVKKPHIDREKEKSRKSLENMGVSIE